MKCPCKDFVDKRKLGCHGFCEDFKAWKKEQDDIKQRRDEDYTSRDCRSTAYSKLVDRIKRRSK